MSRRLIAILRGLDPRAPSRPAPRWSRPASTWIEVPLNSPEPLDSIAALQAALGERAHIGAGTVLTPEEVRRRRRHRRHLRRLAELRPAR